MNSEKVFIGDIKRCTNYTIEPMLVCEDFFGITAFGSINVKSELQEKGAVLIQISDRVFVPLSKIKSFLSYYIALGDYRINGLNSKHLIYAGIPCFEGQQFIDDDSLKPYFNEDMQKRDISIRSLKQDVRKR